MRSLYRPCFDNPPKKQLNKHGRKKNAPHREAAEGFQCTQGAETCPPQAPPDAARVTRVSGQASLRHRRSIPRWRSRRSCSPTTPGYGSKQKSELGQTAGLSLWPHLPRCHFGTTCLNHGHLAFFFLVGGMWVWVKKKHNDMDRRFLVVCFPICQGNPFWGYPMFDPQPCEQSQEHRVFENGAKSSLGPSTRSGAGLRPSKLRSGRFFTTMSPQRCARARARKRPKLCMSVHKKSCPMQPTGCKNLLVFFSAGNFIGMTTRKIHPVVAFKGHPFRFIPKTRTQSFPTYRTKKTRFAASNPHRVAAAKDRNATSRDRPSSGV